MTRAVAPQAKATDVGFSDTMPKKTNMPEPKLGISGLVFTMLILIVALVGGIGTWAVTVPMRSAVVASGKFEVLGDRLIVQHMDGGIVNEINVKDGDIVAAGDVIAKLDSTRSTASLGILKGQLASALAEGARLEAEFTWADTMTLPNALEQMIEEEPLLAKTVALQNEVLAANLDNVSGQIQILENRIGQLRGQDEGTTRRLETLEQQLALATSELEGQEKLFDEGLITKQRYLEMLRDQTAILGEIQIIESERQTTLQQISEQEERILQVRRDWMTQISEQRQANEAEVFDLEQRVFAIADQLKRHTILAPVDGRIVESTINTLGQVIEAGQRLVEIVPTDSEFVVAVSILPQDINEVREGGEARIRLTAYNFRTTPTILGDVIYVAPDVTVNNETGEQFYRAHIRVHEDELAALTQVEVQPGMPAQAMLTTGEQTLADYLLAPVIGGFETALVEAE